jgi:hypothetical protein
VVDKRGLKQRVVADSKHWIRTQTKRQWIMDEREDSSRKRLCY